MREQFEKLPEIAEGLRHCTYNESTNDYHANVAHDNEWEWHTQFVNGAWYAFQEQQKKIDGALKELELLNYYKTGNSDNAIKILKGTDK